MRWNSLRLWRRMLAGAGLGSLCWALACTPTYGQATTGQDATTQPSSDQASSSQPSQSSSQSSQPSTSRSEDTTQGTGATQGTRARSTDSSQAQSTRSSSQSRSGVYDQDSSDTTRSGRDTTRDNARSQRDSTRDSLRESRDSARDTSRSALEDQDDQRSPRSSSQTGQSSQRTSSSRTSDQFDDIHGGAQPRGTRDSARDSSRDSEDFRSTRDTDRDQFDSRRDSSRDEQSYSRSQRDDSRDDQSYSRGQRDERDSFQRDDRSRDYSRDRGEMRDSRQGFDSRQTSRDRDFDQSRDQQADSRDSRSTSRESYSESQSTDVDFRAEDVRPADIGLWFDRSQRDSLVISDVSSSGAITRFGFREGDQIMTVNGWRVSDQSQFVEYLFDPEYRNQRVEVVVWRNGRRVPIQVQPSALIEEYTSNSTQQSDPLEDYGLVLDDRYPNYIVVWKVLPRTPAYYAGIRPGDTIVAWDGYRVSNPQQFTTFVQRGWSGPIDLQVSRNRQIRQLQLNMEDGARRTALRPNVRTDARGNVDVDRILPGRENRIENRIERRDDLRDGSFGAQGWQGGTYYTQPGYVQPGYAQPGVQVYGQGTLQGQPGVQAGAEVRPGLLPRVRGR